MVRSPFPATILAMALLACAGPQQPNPYQTYRQVNPDWSPGVLEYGMTADEALATAFAPMRKRGVRSSAKVSGAYGLMAGEWLENPLPAERLVTPAGEHLVVTQLRCIDAPIGLRVHTVGWYHFNDGLLVGYTHWIWGERCVGTQTIQPSRSRVSFDHLIPEPL